jgi:hypothetical protein
MARDRYFWIGEDWLFTGTAVAPDGTALDLTGGSMELRIASATTLYLSATSPSDITISAGTTGAWSCAILSDDSRQGAISPGTYDCEVESVTASGRVAIQNRFKLNLRMSLRAKQLGTVPASGDNTFSLL